MNAALTPSDLTPKHVRAARALLAWSQQDLAKRAGVATSTIADFERGQRTPVANNAQAIRGALEQAGIRFLATGAIVGPPLAGMTTTNRPGLGIRYVSAEDIGELANRLDGPAILPTLLAQLIRATSRGLAALRFPSDESIQHPGWDGYTDAVEETRYVPRGPAGWEIGSQRDKIAQKATVDYDKRSKDPEHLDPGNASFVFVTPRRWPAKDSWTQTRRMAGPWRNVLAYDADDLVHWLEEAPAVGLWLARRLGKRPDGVRELEDIWQEWSRATTSPLPPELVLADRDDDAIAVLRWLRGDPDIFSLQATTAEEAVAFMHATLAMLPEELANAYRARCLVLTEAAAARPLADAPAPLILVLMEPEPGLARNLAARGHFVFLAYDERPTTQGDVRRLARPSRESISAALIAAGLPEPRAEALARDSGRNLAILRRLMPASPGRVPRWAEAAPPVALLAALLVGGWDEDFEADKAVLTELAGESYEQILLGLAPYTGEFDSPLRKVGSTWRLASPLDAWFLLARHLTTTQLDRFGRIAQSVLGADDPRYEMASDERWLASVRGIQPTYSRLLRHGVGEILILLALQGQAVRSASDTRWRADAIVKALLQDADARRWWSLSRDFRLLAEASPSAFLQAIEESLDKNDPPIGALFGSDGGGVFNTEHLSDLLWALEALAWSPDLLPRVGLVLARLAAIDPGGEMQNRPKNSLRRIFLLWTPQTYAPLDLQFRVIDRIRHVEPAIAWNLLLSILPRSHDTSTPSSKPRWRDYSGAEEETLTWAVIRRGTREVNKRLLDDVHADIPRWLDLLQRFGDLGEDRGIALDQLAAAVDRIIDQSDRELLRNGLRKLLHHHRRFPDADWSLPTGELDRLDRIYDRLAPADLAERHAWLFEQSPQLPVDGRTSWDAEQRQIDEARRQAVRDIYALRGAEGVLALARLSPAAGYIGKALAEEVLNGSELDRLLEVAVRNEEPRVRDFVHGLIVTLFPMRGREWAGALVQNALRGQWGETAVLTMLRALPAERWTWEQAAKAGAAIDAAFWRTVPVFWIGTDGEDLGYAVQKLIEVGRARHAVALAGQEDDSGLASDLLVRVLQEAVRQPFDSRDSNESTMFAHYVQHILIQLDARDNVADDTLLGLEWAFLPLLENSERQAKALMRALAAQPQLFVELIKALYRPDEDNDVAEDPPADPEHMRAFANQAYRLLEIWDLLPGTGEDGSIDAEKLEEWIRSARAEATSVGRLDRADYRIGVMLSASPLGADGVWPAEAVRHVLDAFRNKSMLEGFEIGKRNRRGVTSRLPSDGGALERQEAAEYRRYARALGVDHPYTAQALTKLAESYDWDAERHDQDAERRDWAI